jgi:hypothetical protein
MLTLGHRRSIFLQLMRKACIKLSIVLFLALCPAPAGQNRLPAASRPEQEGPAAIFSAIEKGLHDGDDRLFSAYFSRTVSLNVRGSSPGYYSANQAGQVLRHFLAGRKISSFRFTTVDTSEHPYATGSFSSTGGGHAERIQVYVGLTRERSGWVISQFSIY